MSRSVPPDIIDLEDDSSDEQDVFQDFLTPDTIGDGVEAFRFSPNPSSSPINGGTRNDNYRSYESCLQEILELFPDISKDHFHELYNKQKENGNPYQQLLAQTLIEQILDQNGGQYPKEKDRIKELKRKRNDRNSDEEEAAWWKYADLRDDPMEYAKVARAALQEAFELVPAKYIAEIFKEQGHYYGAFFAILEAVRTLDTSETPPFALLKSRRVGSGMSSVSLMAELREDGYDFEALKKEIDSAWKRRKREDAKLMADKAIERTEAAKDQEHRAKGEVMECGCCFDIVTIHKVTHCNGEEAHFFCLDCARANAENDIGKSRYELRCMDSSGCRASFSRLERQRFLDAKSIETLERLQQQDEIRLADLQNLSTCPFCDFAAICPPIEVDKEFRCHNPECEEVSCRLCKLKSHIPLSCDEFKKEHGVSERRVIEEARTEALIRTCGKCKVRILKEDGCNKVICTKCYAVLCDYCGKDITKTLYNHFDGQGRAPPGLITGSGGKCPLYDESHKRKDQQVEAAGREAMDKVRSEHPDLSEQDLKIKFAMDVQSPTNGRHRDYDYDFHPLNGAFPPHYMRHWDGLDAAAPNYIAGQQQPDDGDDDLFYIGNVRAAANDGNDARPAGPRGEYVQHLMNERHQRLREQAQQLLQQQQQLFHQQYHQARQQVQRHQQQRHLELAEIQRNLAESQRQRDTLQAHRVRMNAMAHNMQRDPLRPRENDLAFNADYNRNGLNIQARARETNEVFQRLAGARALPGERPTNPSSSPVTPLRARHQPNGRNAFDLHPWLATSNDP